MSSPSPDPSDASPPHQWTEFELRTVLSLLCKRIHIGTDALGFATALNNALHGSDPGSDIPVAEVDKLLQRLEVEKKAAMAFIGAQRARRITRTAVLVFTRNIDTDGSLYEWNHEGRRQRESVRAPERLARLAETREHRDGEEEGSFNRTTVAENGGSVEGGRLSSHDHASRQYPSSSDSYLTSRSLGSYHGAPWAYNRTEGYAGAPYSSTGPGPGRDAGLRLSMGFNRTVNHAARAVGSVEPRSRTEVPACGGFGFSSPAGLPGAVGQTPASSGKIAPVENGVNGSGGYLYSLGSGGHGSQTPDPSAALLPSPRIYPRGPEAPRK